MAQGSGTAEAGRTAAETAAKTPVPPPEPLSLGEAFDQMIDKLRGWVEELVLRLPNLVVAVLFLLLFWLAARLVRRTVRHGLIRLHGPIPVAALAGNLVYLVVMAAGMFVALGVLGLDRTVTSLLAGVGIVGLALGFAFQDLASNFVSGVYMALSRPFAVGDQIETNGFFGTVERIELRSLVVRVPQGQRVILPNKQVFESPIKIYSTGEWRVDVTCGVSYGDHLPRARAIAVEAIGALPCRNPEREVELFWQKIGDSSFDFVVRFWTAAANQKEYLAAASQAIEALKEAFDREGITMPFPIRTLDFGAAVAGGGRLADELRAWRPVGDGSGAGANGDDARAEA